MTLLRAIIFRPVSRRLLFQRDKSSNPIDFECPVVVRDMRSVSGPDEIKLGIAKSILTLRLDFKLTIIA